MKNLLLVFLLISLFSCKNISDNEDVTVTVDTTAIVVDTLAIAEEPTERNTTTVSSGLNLEERNEKLIAATKNVKGTLNADVYKDILTRANACKIIDLLTILIVFR